MGSGFLLALLQQAAQSTPPAADATSGWITMQISIGDLGIIGSVIAAYVSLREQIAVLRTQVGPMWEEWNRRGEVRRRG